jgi:hypothetical protein
LHIRIAKHTMNTEFTVRHYVLIVLKKCRKSDLDGTGSKLVMNIPSILDNSYNLVKYIQFKMERLKNNFVSGSAAGSVKVKNTIRSV